SCSGAGSGDAAEGLGAVAPLAVRRRGVTASFGMDGRLRLRGAAARVVRDREGAAASGAAAGSLVVLVRPLPVEGVDVAGRVSGKNTSTGRPSTAAVGMRAPSPLPRPRRFSLIDILRTVRRNRLSFVLWS